MPLISRTTCYAWIAYQTALKAHYPAESYGCRLFGYKQVLWWEWVQLEHGEISEVYLQ
jgi:hypothetical protein